MKKGLRDARHCLNTHDLPQYLFLHAFPSFFSNEIISIYDDWWNGYHCANNDDMGMKSSYLSILMIFLLFNVFINTHK